VDDCIRTCGLRTGDARSTRARDLGGRRTAIDRFEKRDQAEIVLISSDIAEGLGVADILIRDIPDDVVAAIDAKAQRAGVSRSEYLRRALSRERSDTEAMVSVVDLERFAKRFADLDDAEVMRRAWT
jgi:hypothetical protein